MHAKRIAHGSQPAGCHLVVVVADDDRSAASCLDAAVDRVRDAALLVGGDDTQARYPVAIALDDRTRAVGRAVVDEDQLPFARPLLPRQSVQLGPDRLFAVVAREDDAELHLSSIGGNSASA